MRVADVLPGLIDTPIPNSDRYLDGKVASQQGERTIGVDLPNDGGMFRLIQPSEVADAVRRAYHEDKLHWYVPPEIEQIDLEKVKPPEAMRDARIEGQGATPTE